MFSVNIRPLPGCNSEKGAYLDLAIGNRLETRWFGRRGRDGLFWQGFLQANCSTCTAQGNLPCGGLRLAAKKRHIEAVLAMWQSQVESANHLLKSSLEMGRNCTHTINTTTRNNIKMMTMIDSYIHGWAQAGLAQKVSTRWLRLLCTWCGLWPLGQPSSNGSRRVCRTKDETKCFINEACTGWDRKLVDYLIVGTLLCGQPAKWCHTSLSTFWLFSCLAHPVAKLVKIPIRALKSHHVIRSLD